MHKYISSTANTLVKSVMVLQEKSRERKKTDSFVVEGQRELSLALEGGYEVLQLLYCNAFIAFDVESTFVAIEYIEISKEVYEKLAYRNSTEGIIAILSSKTFDLEDISFKSDHPLILVAEAPEKPGNIGALLRTSDAAAIDVVIIANPKTDMYNPNVIRSSVGCVFTTQLATGTTNEILSFLQERNINIFAAALKPDSENYADQDFTQPSAIVVGTEAVGLTENWLAKADQKIIIPMLGKIDSMNVSVSAGILIYEAKRQRGF